MRILIATAIYKRPEITRIVLDYYKDLQREGMDIELLACGSEGEISKQLVESCGWNYFEAKNTPLTRKHNLMFAECRKYKHDAILLIGSDDLLSREIIEYYQNNYTGEETSMYGFNTLHFYSVPHNKLIYFMGFLKDRSGRVTMGAGRLFPRKLLELINYLAWGKQVMNRGLDTITTKTLMKQKFSEVEIDLRTIPGAMMLDIKSEVSLTKFDRLLSNCEEQPVEVFAQKFPKQYEQVMQLQHGCIR